MARSKGLRSVKNLRAYSFLSLCAIAATAFLSLGAAATADETLLPNIAHRLAKSQPIRIVAFGSSSTEGVGASSPLATYPVLLEVDLSKVLHRPGSVAVLNRGVGGQDADDMMRRIDQDAVAPRPDLVIWQTGSNDPMRGVPIDRFKDETRAALLRLKSAGIDVMLLEPQWCAVLDRTPGSGAYRNAVREVGAELDVPVIKRSTLMKAWLANRLVTYDQLFARDGLHMTDGGYALLAHDIAMEIMQDAGVDPAAFARAGEARVAPRQAPPAKTSPAS